MCQYSSVEGFANNWHLVHLGSRAVGGAALIIFEATAVSPEGRISPADLGIWSDGHVTELKKIVEFIHENDSVAGIQLAHAGRKASAAAPWKGGGGIADEEGGWETLAPSALSFSESYRSPKELKLDEIKRLVGDFGAAARRSAESGFKVIELHAAHGYLIHQFLSPLSNKRTDIYGGSFENRCRFLFEIINSVKMFWPEENPLFVRISATDWAEGGWTIEDSIRLVSLLSQQGVDLIDCSSGGNVKANIPLGPGYQVPFAERVKKEGNVLTAAVGLITSAAQAEEIVASGQADMVFMAREMLRDPYFPLRAAKELGATVNWPLQYQRAK